MSQTISAGRTPTIRISSIGGDLSFVGWEGDDILLKADDDELTISQDGDEVNLVCSDDLSMRVPKAATVFIDNIGGDASIRGVMGDIELKSIGGDLSMRDVYNVAIESVHADFSLRGGKGIYPSVKRILMFPSVMSMDTSPSTRSPMTLPCVMCAGMFLPMWGRMWFCI